jgi:uncharacterized protein YecT (DUF1311 family)
MRCTGRIVARLIFACCLPALAQAQLPQSAPQNPLPQTPQIAPPQSAIPQSPLTQAAPAEPIDLCASTLQQPDSGACYEAEFRQADQDLNHIYRAALVALGKDLDDANAKSDKDHAAFDAKSIGILRDAQAAWVKYRDLQCSAAGQQFQAGSIEPLIIARCMTITTRHRIEEIHDAYEIGGRTLE